VGAAVPAYNDVLDTPIIADLDGDKQPEIIFQAGYNVATRLIALSGKDCSVKFDKATTLGGCTHLAVGDLDDDGIPEIVGQGATGLIVFDKDGNQLASTTTHAAGVCTPEHPPAIVNLDGAGPPEIISGQFAVRFVSKPAPAFQSVWTLTPAPVVPILGYTSIAADLDGDDKPEVIVGSRVVDGATGTAKDKSALNGLIGHGAIGDFNKDGKPDIVLVNGTFNAPTRINIIDYANNTPLISNLQLPSSGGGPPTVADFDADGVPDVGVATSAGYFVISLECLKMPKPAQCTGTVAGVLWQSTTQDGSSQGTGSSVFDFNGDGKPEVVYRDECWLRVYNGADGAKLFAAPVTSGTALEMPAIADTDNDGHADLIVPSDDIFGAANCQNNVSRMELGITHPGVTYGVRVYTDPQNRWIPSRPIWNQHSYHITNVTDTGSIPMTEAGNWKTFNNFRQNSQSITPNSTIVVADVTVRDAGGCGGQLKAQVCNRGSGSLGLGMPVSFYDRDPSNTSAVLLCTARTAAALAPGQCVEINCQQTGPIPSTVFVRANADATGSGKYNECHSENDIAAVCGAPIRGCTGSSDCREGMQCDTATGVCAAAPTTPECTADSAAMCTSAGLVCDAPQGLCIGCSSDAQCGESSFCDTRCGQCQARDGVPIAQLSGGGLGSCSTTPHSGASAFGLCFLLGLALLALRRPRALG
jgi:hypothetical protein